MSLSGHLSELRKRIIRCFFFFLAGFLLALNFAPNIVTALTDMGTKYGYEFVYIAPQELLTVYFQIAFVGGAITGIPEAAVEIYGFAKPGLYQKEQKAFRFTLLFGGICFLLGVLFAYKISLPSMLYFLIKFSVDVTVAAQISIQSYVSFLLTVFIIFGVIFELPVISVVLTLIGILKPEYLIKPRKIIIVAIFFVAAVITPPDVVSQVMVVIPMLLLYELSIVLCKTLTKRKKEEQVEGDSDDELDEDDDDDEDDE